MKQLFFIISLFPKNLFVYLVDFYIYTRLYRFSNSYKITRVNIEIAYPDLSIKDVELTSKIEVYVSQSSQDTKPCTPGEEMTIPQIIRFSELQITFY